LSATLSQQEAKAGYAPGDAMIVYYKAL